MPTLYGEPDDLGNGGEDRATCEHEYVSWRKAPGSSVEGAYCPRCGDLQVD